MAFFLPKDHGVLGINRRNLLYLRPYNPGKAVAFADSKLKTKLYLEARGIPVPKLYAKITSRDELRVFDFSSLPESCVLKPNAGYGGEGILIVQGRENEKWRIGDGSLLSGHEVREHCEDILDGMYALHHRRDIAFFEQYLRPHQCFAALHPAGLPDIRIVVFNLVPVMAMLRLPTAESGGRANLHMGGIGLGIDLAKGVTTFATQHGRRLRKLPAGTDPAGFPIPEWDELLLIASRIQQITNIGFLGVDLTLDEASGPQLLEVNARAGLMVQVANLAPLGERLERVEGLQVSSPEKGVRIAQDLFGDKIVREEREERPVVGIEETVEILGGKKTFVLRARLHLDEERSIADPALLRELQKLEAVEPVKEGGEYRMKFQLAGRKVQTLIAAKSIPREEGVRMILGKRDLTAFLIDPGKDPSSPLPRTVDLHRMDEQLAAIDEKIHFLRHLRPGNLAEERAMVQRDPTYNPRFTYEPLRFDPDDLLDRLRYLETDSSPLGILLSRKRDELIAKIRMLQMRGQNDRCTFASIALFGEPTSTLLKDARAVLSQWKKIQKSQKQDGKHPPALLTTLEVKNLFEEVLASYGLREWRVLLQSDAVADCSIGKKAIILRSGATFSRQRFESLVAHEIEAHVLTAENADRQPYRVFERTAGYLETQEGLAVFREEALLPEQHEKRAWPALGVLATKEALTHSFAEVRSFVRHLGFDDARAIRTALKVKRGMGDTGYGGACTRELVYFRGLLLVREFLRGGGDLRDLYFGKISIRDLPLVREIPGLVPPVYLPRGLTSPSLL